MPVPFLSDLARRQAERALDRFRKHFAVRIAARKRNGGNGTGAGPEQMHRFFQTETHDAGMERLSGKRAELFVKMVRRRGQTARKLRKSRRIFDAVKKRDQGFVDSAVPVDSGIVPHILNYTALSAPCPVKSWQVYACYLPAFCFRSPRRSS